MKMRSGWFCEALECRRLLSGYTLTTLSNHPGNGLISDAFGNQYGVTGAPGNGNFIYEICKDSSVENILATLP